MKKLFLTAVAVCALTTASCGGGVGTLIIPTAVISAFEPELVYSHESTAVRLLGVNFGARSKPVTIRFTAETGTPFEGGTSDTYDLVGEVESELQIRSTLPATLFQAAFNAYITILLADGRESTTTDPIANFMPQEVLAITPSTASSGALVAFEVTGNGFQPPDGLVGVRFEAETGTPFFGGASANALASGTVSTPTSIVGNFPDVIAASTTNAFVTVILDSGEIRSATPLITFFPSPAVVNFIPAATSGGLTPPFTVQGTAFAPNGGTATVTLHAQMGTPFANGTSATHTFTGTITSDSTIQGTMTDPAVNATTFATVEVTLPTGGSAISAITLVQIFPGPAITSVTPTPIESGDSSYNLTITGTNFTPTSGIVNLVFTADAGTPFNGGADATLSANGTILSNTTIGVTIPNPDVDASTTVTISGTFPSGAMATSPAAIMTIDPEPPFTAPVWDPLFGTAINGGADNDDGFELVSFTGGFNFDFWGVNYSSCFVGSNGYITFGTGDTDLSESSSEMRTDQPRIAGYWDDLYPTGAQEPYFKQLSDRAVITFDRVTEFFNTGAKSFQFTLWDTGRVDIFYNGMTGNTNDGLIGITPGNSLKTAQAFDFSATVFPAWTDVPIANFPYERWTSAGPDLDPGWIVFEPLGPSFDGSDGYRFTTGP